MRRILAVAAIACTTAALIAGCGSSSSPASNSPGSSGGTASGDYNLGATMPLSGSLSFVGTQAESAMEAWVNSVNAVGGVDGHHVKITFLDDTGVDPSKTTSNVVQLVTQDHVSAVLGFSLSNDCTASVSIAAREGVPILCQNVDPSDISPPDKYVYLAGNLEVNEVAPILQFAKTKVTAAHPRLVILHEDDEGANAFAAKLAAAAATDGWHVAGNLSVSLTATSISAQAAQVISDKPNLVVGELLQQLVAPLVKTMRADKISAPYISEADGLGYSGLAATDDADTYTMYPAQFLTRENAGSGAQAWIGGFAKEGVTSVSDLNSGLGVETALPALVAIAALKHCAYPCSPSAMITALQSTTVDIPGVIADFRYTRTSHSGISSYNVYGWDPATKTPVLEASGLAAGHS